MKKGKENCLVTEIIQCNKCDLNFANWLSFTVIAWTMMASFDWLDPTDTAIIVQKSWIVNWKNLPKVRSHSSQSETRCLLIHHKCTSGHWLDNGRISNYQTAGRWLIGKIVTGIDGLLIRGEICQKVPGKHDVRQGRDWLSNIAILYINHEIALKDHICNMT